MFREDLKRTIDIDDQVEPAEQRLVRADDGEAAPGKAVDHEGRNAHRIESVNPGLHGGADATRSVHQHDDRQLSRSLRNTKFAADRDGCAVGRSGEELPVR